jgi:type II secretory pathway component PulJ
MGFATAMTVVSIAATAASTLMQMQAQRQQQRAAAAQANFQAAVARNNAIIARQNADAIRDRGVAEEEDHRRRIRQTIGAARASQAALGFLVDDPGSTNADLLADLAEAGELDILRIRDRTEAEAHRAIVQGVNFQAQAGLFDTQAAGASAGLGFGSAGSLLGGAARIGRSFSGSGFGSPSSGAVQASAATSFAPGGNLF